MSGLEGFQPSHDSDGAIPRLRHFMPVFWSSAVLPTFPRMRNERADSPDACPDCFGTHHAYINNIGGEAFFLASDLPYRVGGVFLLAPSGRVFLDPRGHLFQSFPVRRGTRQYPDHVSRAESRHPQFPVRRGQSASPHPESFSQILAPIFSFREIARVGRNLVAPLESRFSRLFSPPPEPGAAPLNPAGRAFSRAPRDPSASSRTPPRSARR